MPLERDVDKEWKELGIETDWVTRARIRGFILPSCPWLDAAQRMVNIVGRPAAELTKLFSQQLDLYSLSPQEEAHKEFERKVDTGTREERVKLNLAMAAYTGSPVTPINEEVYRWASDVVETVKSYRDRTYDLYKQVAQMPRVTGIAEVTRGTWWAGAVRYQAVKLYIPYYEKTVYMTTWRDQTWAKIQAQRTIAAEEAALPWW